MQSYIFTWDIIIKKYFRIYNTESDYLIINILHFLNYCSILFTWTYSVMSEWKFVYYNYTLLGNQVSAVAKTKKENFSVQILLITVLCKEPQLCIFLWKK